MEKSFILQTEFQYETFSLCDSENEERIGKFYPLDALTFGIPKMYQKKVYKKKTCCVDKLLFKT